MKHSPATRQGIQGQRIAWGWDNYRAGEGNTDVIGARVAVAMHVGIWEVGNEEEGEVVVGFWRASGIGRVLHGCVITDLGRRCRGERSWEINADELGLTADQVPVLSI